MTDSFKVSGADDLNLLAKRLKEQSGNELKKELLRGLRETNKPTIGRIKDSARSNLPKRGGLADRVARESIGTRTRLTGDSAGVRIQRKRGRSLNEGRLRHPVFGNRKVWKEQSVSKDWFDKPIEDDAPAIRRGLQRVMEDIAAKIARSPL
jgi:hypothetical protein